MNVADNKTPASKILHIFFIRISSLTVYKNLQAQISKSFKSGFRILLRFIHHKESFSNWYALKLKKLCKNYREKLLSVL